MKSALHMKAGWLVKAVLHKEVGLQANVELRTTLEAAGSCRMRPEVVREALSSLRFAADFDLFHIH